MCDMYDRCDMCRMYEKCTYGECITYVSHIARNAQATYIAHRPHIKCVTVESVVIRDPFAKMVFEQSGFGASGLALVRSCGSAGVAPGDGRHQPLPRSLDAPDLDAGSASRYASVHRTPSAPGKGGYGMLNSVCCVRPRPVRTFLLVQVVFDEPPPGADGNRFESTPWTVGTSVAYGRSKFTSGITKTPVFVLPEGRVRGSRSPNPKLAFRPWPLASSQPDRAEGRTGIRRGPGSAARRIPPTAQKY